MKKKQNYLSSTIELHHNPNPNNYGEQLVNSVLGRGGYARDDIKVTPNPVRKVPPMTGMPAPTEAEAATEAPTTAAPEVTSAQPTQAPAEATTQAPAPTENLGGSGGKDINPPNKPDIVVNGTDEGSGSTDNDKKNQSDTTKKGETSSGGIEIVDDLDLEQIRAAYNDTVYSVIDSNAQRIDSHISTDKPVYRPGDVMFIEVFLFDAFTKAPWYSSNFRFYVGGSFDQYQEPYVYLNLEVVDSLGRVVYQTGSSSLFSTISFTFRIPETATGGLYKLRTTGGYNLAESVRVVRVRNYERESLQIQVQLDQDVYSPGDIVRGDILAKPIDGSALTDQATYSYSVSFGGNQEIREDNQVIDALGRGSFDFQIPEGVNISLASIAFNVYYLATVQTYIQTVQITQPDQLYIEFYPETYNYVYEVLNRVYFQVYANKDKKAYAEIRDAVLMSYGRESIAPGEAFPVLTDLATTNNGRGVFEFVPYNDRLYILQFQEGDVLYQFDLKVDEQPDIDQMEINFSLKDKVIQNSQDLTIRFETNSVLNPVDIYIVGLFNKERILYLQEIKFVASTSSELTIPSSLFPLANGGVLRVDLYKILHPLIWYDRYQQMYIKEANRTHLPNPFYDTYFVPKGEIIFMKKPSDSLEVSVVTDKEVYEPGDLVKYEIQVRDKNTGEIVENRKRPFERSFVSLVVTDNSVYNQVESRQLPPSLPAMVYLEDEVERIDYEFLHSDEYIEHWYTSEQGVNAESGYNTRGGISADSNLELLLGVQGWRYGYFFPQLIERWPRLVQKMTRDEKMQLEKLFAYNFGYISYQTRRFENVVMKESGGILGGGMPEPAQQDGGSGSQQQGEETPLGQDTGTSGQSASVTARELEVKKFLEQYYFECLFQPNTRLYRHQKRFDFISDMFSRYDTTETVLYQAAVLNDKHGRTSGTFYLSDLITSFRITANAFDTTGRLGYNISVIRSTKTFYLDVRLPTFLTIDDALSIPVVAHNNANVTLNAQLSINELDQNLRAIYDENQVLSIAPSSSSVDDFILEALGISRESYIQVKGEATNNGQKFEDSVLRAVRIVSSGVPRIQSQQGLISQDEIVSFTVNLPSTMIAGTANFIGEIYPTNYALLIQAIKNIVSGPTQCYDCIFGNTHALVLAAQAIKDDAILASQLQDALPSITITISNTYSLIAQFQASSGELGQLAGRPENNVILSAYGLLELEDMKSVIAVDEQVITRLADYIFDQLSSDDSRTISPWYGQPYYVVNAFVIWVLTQAGFYNEKIQAVIDRLEVIAQDQTQNIDANSYFIGLISGIYFNINRTTEAYQYADYLTTIQDTDGSIRQEILDNTPQDYGFGSTFEASAIAVLDWQHNYDRYATNIARGIIYLIKESRYRYFGSTQGDILALKAIINYLRHIQGINGSGDFVLKINGVEVDRQSFDSDTINTIVFDLSKLIKENETFVPGAELEITLDVENFVFDNQSNTTPFQVLYYLATTYDDRVPPASTGSALAFSVVPVKFNPEDLGSQELQGEFVSYQITISNTLDRPLGLTILEIRPPSCVQASFSMFENLKSIGIIDNYEFKDGNSLILLYIAGFGSVESRGFIIDFVQTFTGTCVQRPFDAYLYYNRQQQVWVTF